MITEIVECIEPVSSQHTKLMYSLARRPENEVDWQSRAGLDGAAAPLTERGGADANALHYIITQGCAVLHSVLYCIVCTSAVITSITEWRRSSLPA